MSLHPILVAQIATANPAQSSQVSSAINSYESSLLHGPVATSLAFEIGLDVPATELASIESHIDELLPTPSSDLYSFGTAPPVTFSTPSWAMSLPTDVQSDLASLRTSVVLAEASIVRSVLSITASPSVASAPAAQTTNSGASVGMKQSVGVLVLLLGPYILGLLL